MTINDAGAMFQRRIRDDSRQIKQASSTAARSSLTAACFGLIGQTVGLCLFGQDATFLNRLDALQVAAIGPRAAETAGRSCATWPHAQDRKIQPLRQTRPGLRRGLPAHAKGVGQLGFRHPLDLALNADKAGEFLCARARHLSAQAHEQRHKPLKELLEEFLRSEEQKDQTARQDERNGDEVDRNGAAPAC
jgi:hypothetical protein